MEICAKTLADTLAFFAGVSPKLQLETTASTAVWAYAQTASGGSVRHKLGTMSATMPAVELDARALAEYVRALMSGMAVAAQRATAMTLNWGAHGLTLSSPHGTARIGHVGIGIDSVLPPDDDGSNSITFDPTELRGALERVLVAVDRVGARPALGCVLIDPDDGSPRLVTADGWRLAAAPLVFINNGWWTRALFHWRDAQLWARWLKLIDEPVNLTLTNENVSLSSTTWTLRAHNQRFAFPDYRPIVQPGHSVTLSLDTVEARRLCDSARALLDKSAPAVTLSADGVRLTVSTPANERGDVTLSAACAGSGEGVITVNAAYLSDALRAVSSPDVELAWGADRVPLRVRDTVTDAAHYIMPIARR